MKRTKTCQNTIVQKIWMIKTTTVQKIWMGKTIYPPRIFTNHKKVRISTTIKIIQKVWSGIFFFPDSLLVQFWILSRTVIYLEQKAFNLTISILPILAAPIDQGFCNQAAAFKWRDISQRAVEKSVCVVAWLWLWSINIGYRISANSFRGNYSFLNLTLCTVTFDHST